MTANFAGQAESLPVSKYHTQHCSLVDSERSWRAESLSPQKTDCTQFAG